MAKKNVYKTIRELNSYLKETNKTPIIRKGIIVGLLGSEKSFFNKRKLKKKRGKK